MYFLNELLMSLRKLFTLERSGNAERRRYEIRQEQIHGLREVLGFRWVDIARMVGMSPRTFCRRM